mgnify:CR=1 FL=1
MKKYLIIIVISFSITFANSDTSSVAVSTLPFVFYSNSIGWVFGTFTSVKGYPQENSFTKIGCLISTNRSKYFYFQADEVHRASSGIVAAGIGFSHRQTLVGCQYGVCYGMGNSSR